MATKKTEKKSETKKTASAAKAAPKAKATKAAKPAKGAPVSTSARHPRAKVTAAHGGKAALAKTLAASVAREGEDKDAVEARLKTASNAQLLRLQRTVTIVKEKWGDREKLIAAISSAQKKSKDKDYLAKLATFSLPQLVDLAKSTGRSA